MELISEHDILEYLPDTVVTIRKIYDLDNGRMDQSVDILEEWMKKQNHFVNKNFSREYLEKTIIPCKGSVEKAKKQIDKLCTYRTLFPTFFISSDVKAKLSELNEIIYALPLPKMTKDYQRIFVIKLRNQKKCFALHFTELYRLVIVIAEYLKAHDYSNGFVIVDDLRDLNLKELLTTINLVEMQQFLTILMEGFGAKTKGIHLITKSTVIDIFLKVVTPFLSPKLAKRIIIHPDLESLHQAIDKDLLPLELEGNEVSINELQDKWKEVLGTKENEEYLAEMKASCTTESLRQTDNSSEQYMELPGSFRTLTVD